MLKGKKSQKIKNPTQSMECAKDYGNPSEAFMPRYTTGENTKPNEKRCQRKKKYNNSSDNKKKRDIHTTSFM
jgi:hypothetical protein